MEYNRNNHENVYTPLQDRVYHGEPDSEQLQGDALIIAQGIESAQAEARPIDDRTARYIASQLHGGQASALYSLASTGNIIDDDVYRELYEDLESHEPDVAAWTEALREYCQTRADKGPVPGWAEKAAALDRMDATRERVRMLGGVAVAPEGLDAENDGQDQALAVGAASLAGAVAHDHVVHPDRLDELFGEPPDEEIGRADELGWFGLITSGPGEGGAIISQDEQGFRYVWETVDGDELDARWQEILHEYQAYDDEVLALERKEQDERPQRIGYACPECEEPIVERVQAFGRIAWTHRDGEPLCPVPSDEGSEPAQPGVWRDGEIVPLAGEPDGDDADGDGPRIYVASLSDYNEGILHGRWLAADHEPEDLQAAVDRVLASSPAREYGEAAEEWAVHDYDGSEKN